MAKSTPLLTASLGLLLLGACSADDGSGRDVARITHAGMLAESRRTDDGIVTTLTDAQGEALARIDYTSEDRIAVATLETHDFETEVVVTTEPTLDETNASAISLWYAREDLDHRERLGCHWRLMSDCEIYFPWVDQTQHGICCWW